MPSTFLDAGDIAVNKSDNITALLELTFQREE